MALRLPKFIKLPEHNRFEYRPLYYDKRKEELEKKVKKYKLQKERQEKQEYKPEIKGKFNRSYNRTNLKKQKKAANIRLAIIVIFTTAIVYIILEKADIINKMFNVLISE